MSERDNRYETWVAEREAMEEWCATVDAALPPFERTMPRDPVEAEFLRSIGTPEALIGPERGASSDSPDASAAASTSAS